MGWSFRKSIKIGAGRVTFSKSGISASVGIQGARITAGSRGTYITIGRKGLYYRKKIGSVSNSSSQINNEKQNVETPRFQENTQLNVIETADVERLVDSDSAELLEEINQKHCKVQYCSVLLWSQVILFLFFVWVAPSVIFLVIVLLSLLYIPLRKKDKERKNVLLNFELDSEAQQAYEKLLQSISQIEKCKGFWRINASGRTNDLKRNAGASELVSRSNIRVVLNAPKFITSNVPLFQVDCGDQNLCFLPDRLLVFQKGNVGAVCYEDLEVFAGSTRFIEDSSSAPRDAVKVGETWRYVNKNGSPDRRFSNNKKLPVLQYGELQLNSRSGLNIKMNLSRTNPFSDFFEAINNLRKFFEMHKK